MSIGKVLEKQGLHTAALAEMQTSLTITESTLGVDHPDTHTIRKDFDRIAALQLDE